MRYFFFNDTATTEIYTLSLHDALPISPHPRGPPREPRNHDHGQRLPRRRKADASRRRPAPPARPGGRSEEHTSELQSRQYLVCRLLLEKKKTRTLVKPLLPSRLLLPSL